MTENPSQIANKVAPSPANVFIGDPAKFGRVAEDGTVYVQTPAGERAVGSYPGKSADEALAYFVRKFEEVASEVALLASRIKSGAMVPSDAHEAVNKLRDRIHHINAVGDLQALVSSMDQLPELIESYRAEYEAKKAAAKEAKEAKRAEAISLKEVIVSKAEALVDSEEWKKASEELKDLLDQWKKAPRLDKNTDGELWKRFSHSRNKFDKRRRTHFAKLGEVQKTVANAKREIVEKAEALADSTDWVNTAKKYKALMDQWKASGRGKHADDAKLWTRFKTAQDKFFAAKNSDLEKREGSMAENQSKREALLPKIEALLPINDLDKVKKEFRELMNEWSKIGMTKREVRAAFDKRIDKVADAIKELEAEKWRKSDPAAKARAKDVVDQLTAAIAGYESAAQKAEASGNAKKAKESREAAEARKVWLIEAEKNLAEFN